MPSPKPIHGAPAPSWRRFGLEEQPPEPTEYRIGQRVIFTNEYGLKFEMEVVGFAKDSSFQGRFIHTIRAGTDGSGSAWWFPHRPSELSPIPAE